MDVNKKVAIEPRYLDYICDYMHKEMGIYIEQSKKHLLGQKLSKLMTDAGIESSAEYYHYIVSPAISDHQKKIKDDFMDNVTVHKTNFFRENKHFEIIKQHINDIIANNPTIKYNKEIRVWSAACSVGDEPYTLSMLFKEILPEGMSAKILATDIAPDSIRKALTGVYKFGPEDYISDYYKNKYFTNIGNGEFRVNDDVRQSITFRLFNLMEQFPFKKPFDIIFCRNVMIYFDKPVQERLVNKFYDALVPGGLFFIGHSESLIQVQHKFNYYEPTVYQR